MRWARVVEPTTDIHGPWRGEHSRKGQRQRSGAHGISAGPDVQRRRSSKSRPCGSGSLRLTADQNVARSVERNLSVERVLAGGQRAAREDRRRGFRGRRADLDRVRVPRLEAVRQATGLAPVALHARRSLEPSGPTRSSGPSRPAGLLRRLPCPNDMLDGLLSGVPERRRPEQGDDERGGGECDGEALQGALKLAPCRAVAYPIAKVTRTVAWISCLPDSIGAPGVGVRFASSAA